MSMWTKRALFLVPLLAACKEAPLTCPRSLAAGVAVTVRDSATGAFVASGAMVTAYSTLYSDTVLVPVSHPELDNQPVYLAYGHAGPFLVTVEKAGYREWVKTDVATRSDQCGLETTRLTALLQASP